jgi:hypothetical protein
MDPHCLDRRQATAISKPDLADWPVDVQRTDASGEVDLGRFWRVCVAD